MPPTPAPAHKPTSSWQSSFAVLIALACVAIASAPAHTEDEAAGAVSGLPVPRFVSLKADKVNLRGIGELAADSGFGRNRGLGLSLALIEPPHRPRGAVVEEERNILPPPERRCECADDGAIATERARLGQDL